MIAENKRTGSAPISAPAVLHHFSVVLPFLVLLKDIGGIFVPFDCFKPAVFRGGGGELRHSPAKSEAAFARLALLLRSNNVSEKLVHVIKSSGHNAGFGVAQVQNVA